MSRSAWIATLVTTVAGASLTSCARQVSPPIGPYTLLDATFPVTIDFTCDDGVNAIGLTDGANHQAWSVSATKGQPIQWRVPTNVTIDSIQAKHGGSLPVTTHGQQGGADGQAYNASVDDSARVNGTHYPYSIAVTCTPHGGGDRVRLVIDPDMIIL